MVKGNEFFLNLLFKKVNYVCINLQLCFVFIFQVIGLIIAATGVIISALFWAFLNTCSSIVPVGSEVLDINVCACGVAADLTGCEYTYYCLFSNATSKNCNFCCVDLTPFPFLESESTCQLDPS